MYVVFTAGDGTGHIHCTASVDGEMWPAAQPINTVDTTPAPPAVAVSGNDLHIFWMANDPTRGICTSVLSG